MKKRQIGAGLLAAGAALLGAAGYRFVRRRQPAASEALPPEQKAEMPVLAAELPAQLPLSERAQPVLARLAALSPLSAALGLAGWTLAQAQLLESRQPVLPLLLYGGGLALLLPALRSFPSGETHGENKTGSHPFAASWGGVWGMAALLVLMVVAAVTPGLFPNPPALPAEITQRDSAFMFEFLQAQIRVDWGAVFAVLLVPAAYLLVSRFEAGITGRRAGFNLAGLLAAGFLVVSGWPLVLVKTGDLYTTLAFFAALLVTALANWFAASAAPRNMPLASVIGAFALLILVTWLVSPLFGALALLLPAFNLLYLLENRFSRLQVVLGVGAALVLALPFLLALDSALAANSLTRAADGLNPALALLDSLAASLLLFNLTGDPNPLHGIFDRPVFSPALAALFAFGLLAWMARIRSARRWLDGLPLAALVFSLLPSALAATYPDAQRAALALPVALFFAAYGAACLARLFVARLGSLGAALALWLLLVALAFTAADAYRHYTAVFLPAAQQAAHVLETPP
jgi:hypothetical protein